MNSPNQGLRPRLSVNVELKQQFHENPKDLQPSIQAQRLINYLKSNPNPDLNRKLREQIFFKKIQKNQNLKRSSSQTKLTQNRTGIQNELKNESVTNQQKLPKARFFSPKNTNKKLDDNQHKKIVHPFSVTEKQIQIVKGSQYQKCQNKKFRLNRENLSLNQQLSKFEFQQENKESKNEKNKYCPQFIKKNIKSIQSKTSKLIPQSSLSSLDFKFLKFLGQGTFGDVFLALHKKTRSIFTIKRYRKQIIKSHQLEDKFLHDIKIQYRMNDPYIVKMYGFFDDQAFIYLIFQCMESGSLTKMIQQKGGKLSQGQISRTILQINQAIFNLHQKMLIHRDIKPSSILTCFKVCKLCDTQWIQSSQLNRESITLCKQIDYTAPQALEGKQITPQFDVWSLGLIIFQLLTGKKLISATTQKGLIRKIITFKIQHLDQQIPIDCPSYLRQLIIRTLNPIPSKRISSKQISQLQVLKGHQPELMFTSNFQQNQTHKKTIKKQMYKLF